MFRNLRNKTRKKSHLKRKVQNNFFSNFPSFVFCLSHRGTVGPWPKLEKHHLSVTGERGAIRKRRGPNRNVFRVGKKRRGKRKRRQRNQWPGNGEAHFYKTRKRFSIIHFMRGRNAKLPRAFRTLVSCLVWLF